jgi:hypothetical protein
MATIVDLETLWEERHSLKPQEVKIIPLHAEGDLRVRLLLTRCGNWPAHQDDKPETYIVMRGEVRYTTDHPFVAKAGTMVTFTPHEAHSADIRNGALSLNVHYISSPPVHGSPCR